MEMPIKKTSKKKGKGKGPFTLTSPTKKNKKGKPKVLARGSKAYVRKRAAAIAYFRSQ
jgi:hypothetical protein